MQLEVSLLGVNVTHREEEKLVLSYLFSFERVSWLQLFYT